MLKVGGLWVSPVEVENALVAHDAVQECAVIGREDADALVKPMAFVVLCAGVAGTPALAAALQDFVRSRLAEYKRPRWVRFLDELPKTATGKIQRFKLRAGRRRFRRRHGMRHENLRGYFTTAKRSSTVRSSSSPSEIRSPSAESLALRSHSSGRRRRSAPTTLPSDPPISSR